MVRTQIQLTEEQARKLRRRAKQQRLSVAEVIRRCVDEGLSRETPNRAQLYARANELVVGRFPDREGAADVSRDHDRYLEDAFG